MSREDEWRNQIFMILCDPGRVGLEAMAYLRLLAAQLYFHKSS